MKFVILKNLKVFNEKKKLKLKKKKTLKKQNNKIIYIKIFKSKIPNPNKFWKYVNNCKLVFNIYLINAWIEVCFIYDNLKFQKIL